MKSKQAVGPDRQVGFYDALLRARQTVLSDALQHALHHTDPKVIRSEIHAAVPSDCLSLLARAGIRDEYVFPAPTLLEQAPRLVGYYRLLLGVPQKTLYGTGTGMGKFKALEQRGVLVVSRQELEAWCSTLSAALCALVRELATTLQLRDLNDLQLLTLGQQIQGSRNNSIGRAASDGVFAAITAVVRPHLVSSDGRKLVIRSPTGSVFCVEQASDPDIVIGVQRGKDSQPLLAIEIKGGGDGSNVHNRAGEAEKSHLKTKRMRGYPECWTVIASANHSLEQLARESPSTDAWFDVLQVIAQDGPSWLAFDAQVRHLLDLP